MYLYVNKFIKTHIGQVIASFSLNKAKDLVTIEFQSGKTLILGVSGECCSQSWIEHLEMPDNMSGATLLDFTESSMDLTDDPDINSPDKNGYKHECLQVYNSRFITDRGEIVLEYRNSSNGYYGGYLTVEDEADTSQVKGVCISLGCGNEASTSRQIGQITVPVCRFHENNILVIDDAIVPKVMN